MVLLLDNYDSFTYNLRDYILQLGLPCRVVRNDEMSLEEMAELDFAAAVISPGPKTPAEAGITKAFIERFHSSVPLFGVCLGLQAIGEFYGAKLVKAEAPMHGKTSVINHNGHALFAGLPKEIEVMRYHSLVLKEVVQTPLQVIATSGKEVMAIAHPELPIAGVQFHPESILTPHGLQLLRNWFVSIGLLPNV